jgi:uncharacterized protein YqjF (DUF2071 family)
VFVKEIVPRRAIATVARSFYGEPYETWTMTNARSTDTIEYGWHRSGCANNIVVSPGENEGVPEPGSHGEFIIEHYWGYTMRGHRRTDEYKVEHPKWELHAVTSSEISVDFAGVYGTEFSLLTGSKPHSTVFTKGSEIAVYKGAKITR